MMLEATDTSAALWFIVRSDDKKRVRLNVISHVLETVPHRKARRAKSELPTRSRKGRYDDQAAIEARRFVREVH
jgi:hypothetical protein